MVISASLRRGVAGLVVPAALLTSLIHCGGTTAGDHASTLRDAFPKQAEDVLAGAVRFEQNAERFVLERLSQRWGTPLDVELPLSADDPIVMRGGETLVEVRQSGVKGSAVRSGNAISYAREGGVSYWTGVVGGVEEWLYLANGVADSNVPAASWHVNGAPLTLQGDAVMAGTIRIEAPIAYGPRGEELQPKLAIDGQHIELMLDATTGPVLIDPMWSHPANMLSTRMEHDIATLTATNTVLVAGGRGGGIGGGGPGVLSGAEIYDPVTHMWSPTNAMNDVRTEFTLTSFNNGNVIAVGGWLGFTTQWSAEIFTPGSGWSYTNSMAYGMARQTDTRLMDANDRILYCGGVEEIGKVADFFSLSGSGGIAATDNCEIFDPTLGGNGQFISADRMFNERMFHDAGRFANGDVIVSGGENFGTCLTSAEIWDDVLDQWNNRMPMNAARAGHTLTVLQNGDVLVTGGMDNAQLVQSTAEIYNVAGNTWTTLASTMSSARVLHTATMLDNGQVLIVGGFTNTALNAVTTAVDIYDPGTQTFNATVAIPNGPAVHAAIKLNNGNILVAGGSDGSLPISNSIEFELAAPNGTPCSGPAECLSMNCVDGVCCDTPCVGTCMACTTTLKGSGNDGVCEAIDQGVDMEDECADLGQTSCGSNGSCDGGGSCDIYGMGTVCAPDGCMGDDVLLADTCDGMGTCVDNGVTDCGTYSCDMATCYTSCSDHPQCAVDAYCEFGVSGTCVPKKPDGTTATDPVECLSGFVADGVCCNESCDLGVCDACTVALGASTDGTCTSQMADCDDGNECTSEGCDPNTGCFSASVIDGTPCTMGICVAGTCVPDPVSSATVAATTGATTGSGAGTGGEGGGTIGDLGPVRLEGGGICASNYAGGRDNNTWGWLLLAAGLLGLRRRD